MTLQAETMADHALVYARRGLRVLPIHWPVDGACSCGRADCESPAKHPLMAHGVHDATSDDAAIREMWARWPDANVAVATGGGVMVADIDPRHGGSLDALGEIPDDAPRVATGGGGWHVWFAGSGPGAKIDGSAVEIKGDGGYVLAPPSFHITGREYTFTVGFNGALPALPAHLRRTRGRRPPPAPDETISPGDRHNRVLSYAGHLRNRGLNENELAAVLLDFNRRLCVPPLPDDDVVRIARDAQGWAPPAAATSPPADGGSFPLTDLGNAERFVAEHWRTVRHVYPLGWHVWDGRRWGPDEDGEVVRLAKATVRRIHAAAAACEDDDERKRIATWARTSESEARLRAMVNLAASERPVVARARDLDGNPWLLNAANGTIDLRTGTLRPHDPADLMSKLTPVRFDPDARSERWEYLIERATGGDPELAGFVQRLAGYTATGVTSEEVLAFIHGPGATSKSTAIDAITAALGDYSMTADFETFLQRRGDAGIRNDVARLHGARMVVSLEVDDGAKLAEGLLKAITGGDTISARFLYHESFEFKPSFCLWLVANSRPRARAGDDALWRRLLQIPFSVVIPPEERDPTLKFALRSDPDEQAAILAWIVRGCLEWQRRGLDVPQRVRDYTDEYRRENDPIGDWLADACELDSDGWAGAKELRDSYEAWCETNGSTPISHNAQWGKALKAHGCAATTKTRNHPRGWSGIRIIR